MTGKSNNSSNRVSHRLINVALSFIAVMFFTGVISPVSWSQNKSKVSVKAAKPGSKAKRVSRITPQIPSANRYQKNKVFLENADVLSADEKISADYQVLKGNVQFRRGDMYMYCDSAYFYDKTSSLDAFGNVRMTQGDTLTVTADVLHYYGEDEVAQLRHNVRLENRNMTLITDSLDYEVQTNVGYYFNGGTIVDSENNELSSEFGRYELDTKNAEFSSNVHLINDKYEMLTNLLNYNTRTHIADITEETMVVSDSNTVYTSRGWYNTQTDESSLFDRSVVVTKDGATLTGDTVYYNQAEGRGEAWGNMVITDTTHKVILDGGYGFYDENANVSFATIRARAREFSEKDTLYLHGDTLRSFLDSDSLHVLTASAFVRFYRKDLQGLCDSMAFNESDSILRMFRHAIVWSGSRQINGEQIDVHFQDSTADWARLPNFGFMAEHVGEDTYYNQLSGREMTAYFEDKEVRKLDVKGNVEVLLFPQENDSTYNKVVTAESSYLIINLKPKQEIEKITMWPEVNGVVTPLYLARKSKLYLPSFNWYDSIRPKDPDDIFVISDEMRSLFAAPDPTARHRRSSN